MNLTRAHFSILSCLLLVVWVRFQDFFVRHWILNALLISVAIVAFYPLIRSRRGHARYVLLVLWLLITTFFVADFVQNTFLNHYSESRFSQKTLEVTGTVEQRAKAQLAELRNHLFEVRDQLESAENHQPAALFVYLQDQLGNVPYGWAVYDPTGTLVAWKGQFNPRELPISSSTEDVSVYTDLHQQFLRLKRAFLIGKTPIMVVVNKPIAADYGIENRYLQNYNLLTDDLPIRPDLLYNSQVTTTGSTDLIVRNFLMAPEFTVAVLFKKAQYQEFLADQRFLLHWWFELIAIVLVIFSIVYAFFEFIGTAGKSVSVSQLRSQWITILIIAASGCVLITQFSAFGSSSLLTTDTAHQIWWSRVTTPGGLMFSSFFVLNVAWSLAILLWKWKSRIQSRNSWLNYLFLLVAIVISAVLIQGYFEFARTTLVHDSFDPIDQPFIQADLLHLAYLLGTLWLDLSFLVFVGILLGIGMSPFSRTHGNFLRALGILLLISISLFTLLFTRGAVPAITSTLLLFGVGALVFYLPVLNRRLERLNLFSRFLVALLVFTTVSFVFHFTRFHFAGDARQEFIERAAKQVQEQDRVNQQILTRSRRQLDQALQQLSIDPKIPDLAFRLWTRTDLARYGLRSAVEIYDDEGRLLNRFSVNLPRLAIPILNTVLEGGWGTERRTVMLGNVRKPVHFSVRDIPPAGFLVIEAAQDFESLPFMPPTNPFQELFRFNQDIAQGPVPDLNVYDFQWRPIFVSRSDLSLSTQKGQELLRKTNSAWVRENWGDRKYEVFYFRIPAGYAALILPAVAFYTHLVHLIDLLLINLLWLSVFSLIFLTFFRHYLVLHFHAQTVGGFNFFQKLLLAFVVFSMVPIVSFSLVMRNYARETQIEEVTSRALNSFAVATKVVGDYLFYRAEEPDVTREQLFSNELLEWISQVTQQDVTFYYDRYLLASSNRELYTAGLMPEQMPGQTYVDLFLKGQKYSIHEAHIGDFRFLNVSGRIYTGRYRDEVITIPFLIEERSLQEEITELREYMILTGAGLVLLAVLLGYFLANRFSQPVHVLIEGTGEMSRGNLQYRIEEHYRDEFRLLVNSFNAMAASLDEQQTALERRRAYIENILNNITTAVISVDSETNIATFNPAAVSLFRISTPLSGALADLVPLQGDWQPVHAVIHRLLANREKFGVQEVALRRDQQDVYWRLTWVPLFAEGEWNGAVLLVEDITEIIRSNRLSAWAEMARRVAHEVKNPLTPIQLSIEHLVRVYEDRSENFGDVLRECSDAVLKQVKTLRRLVSDFSQYGRPTVLNRTIVHMPGFLRELISHYRFPEGIGVKMRIDEDLPPVKIDADKVRGALMNIIENGLQAMNGGGSITLCATRTDSAVRIEIHDTGRGVPKEILPRLFEPYFSTKTGGTGLGLAIARKNIEDHGGRIQVESREGHGTTVIITLPA